ncbi:MAG: hypothetical protein Q6373_001415 [Candidatus Sigynarchaeota archaeon]
MSGRARNILVVAFGSINYLLLVVGHRHCIMSFQPTRPSTHATMRPEVY